MFKGGKTCFQHFSKLTAYRLKTYMIKFLDVDIIERSSTKFYGILGSVDNHVQQLLEPLRLIIPSAFISSRIDSKTLHRTF